MLRAVDPVHCLRVITQPETAPTSNPAESEKQHAAPPATPRAQHPKPTTTKACRRFCVAHLCGQLAIADVSDAGSVRLYPVGAAHVFGQVEPLQAFGNWPT